MQPLQWLQCDLKYAFMLDQVRGMMASNVVKHNFTRIGLMETHI